jgi:putative heme-binding domain-containing protein
MTVIAVISCVALVPPSLAQHAYPEVEVARGGQFFRGNCAGCHGQDGDLVEGVGLADPIFLQGVSDQQLVGIIMDGIPGTAMPPSNYSPLQAGNIVAYLRDLSELGRGAPVNGNPERGAALVASNRCLTCHRIDGTGSRVGPDLSRIGLLRRTDEIEESIVDPNASVAPENRYIRVETSGGEVLTGRLLNHDRVTVQFIDTGERLRSMMKSTLGEFAILEDSPMPAFGGRLESQELEDILSYLVSLKGGDSQ